MKCIYCGQELPDDAKKCKRCKAAVIKPKSDKKKEKK